MNSVSKYTVLWSLTLRHMHLQHMPTAAEWQPKNGNGGATVHGALALEMAKFSLVGHDVKGIACVHAPFGKQMLDVRHPAGQSMCVIHKQFFSECTYF